MVESAGGRGFLDQLAVAVPAPFVGSAIGQVYLGQLALGGVAVAGYPTLRISFTCKIAQAGVIKRPGLAIAVDFRDAALAIGEQKPCPGGGYSY